MGLCRLFLPFLLLLAPPLVQSQAANLATMFNVDPGSCTAALQTQVQQFANEGLAMIQAGQTVLATATGQTWAQAIVQAFMKTPRTNTASRGTIQRKIEVFCTQEAYSERGF